MEFVDGEELGTLLTRGSLNFEQGMKMFRQICSSLHYAHEKGIVHCDVKPSNILVTLDLSVKVLDFGLSRVVEKEASQTLPDHSGGSPQFMAPEQFNAGAPVDRRTDIYALGVMLYLMLTGRLPTGKFAPASRLNNDLDPGFDEIIARALEPHPEDRYPDALAFARDVKNPQRAIRSTSRKKEKNRQSPFTGDSPRTKSGKFWIPLTASIATVIAIGIGTLGIRLSKKPTASLPSRVVPKVKVQPLDPHLNSDSEPTTDSNDPSGNNPSTPTQKSAASSTEKSANPATVATAKTAPPPPPGKPSPKPAKLTTHFFEVSNDHIPRPGSLTGEPESHQAVKTLINKWKELVIQPTVLDLKKLDSLYRQALKRNGLPSERCLYPALPSDSSRTFSNFEIVQMRSVYDSQFDEIELKRQARGKQAIQSLQSELKTLTDRLTREDRIPQAVKVRKFGKDIEPWLAAKLEDGKLIHFGDYSKAITQNSLPSNLRTTLELTSMQEGGDPGTLLDFQISESSRGGWIPENEDKLRRLTIDLLEDSHLRRIDLIFAGKVTGSVNLKYPTGGEWVQIPEASRLAAAELPERSRDRHIAWVFPVKSLKKFRVELPSDPPRLVEIAGW